MLRIVRSTPPWATALAGAVLTVVTAAAMTWRGLHHDAAGTGPGDVEVALLWGALALGLVLLFVGLVRWGRSM